MRHFCEGAGLGSHNEAESCQEVVHGNCPAVWWPRHTGGLDTPVALCHSSSVSCLHRVMACSDATGQRQCVPLAQTATSCGGV